MADYSSVSTSIQSLYDKIEQNGNQRDGLLKRLKTALQDLFDTLGPQLGAGDGELQAVIDQCRQSCQEFEQSVERFSENPKTDFKDWSKVGFRESNLRLFMDIIDNYRSTIWVGRLHMSVRISRLL